MSRRLPLVVAVAFTAVVAACGSDGSTPRGATRRSTTSSSSSTSSTTTLAPDPRGARFVLTPVAAVDTPTAMAVRTGDDTLYVTEQAGRVRAIRNGALDPNAVIDLRDTIASGGERG
ncbi:MAG: hypothetical protein ACXV8Y_12375, partial [Acidimicrobiia bacterium]